MTNSPAAEIPPLVAVVTGALRGIGAAVATRLAADGCQVVVVHRSGDPSSICAAIRSAGGVPHAIRADIGAESEVRQLFRELKRDVGRVDMLINNAGITRDGFTAAMSIDKWSSVVDTNLTGTFLCCREAAKIMMDRRSGSIVNISSVAGLVGTAGQPNYSAAKAGLIGLTKSLAAELGGRGIRVNAVVPGFVGTDMLDAMPRDQLHDAIRSVPLGRSGTADEIAEAVAWIAGSAASYVTGTALVVDGGLTRH